MITKSKQNAQQLREKKKTKQKNLITPPKAYKILKENLLPLGLEKVSVAVINCSNWRIEIRVDQTGTEADELPILT